MVTIVAVSKEVTFKNVPPFLSTSVGLGECVPSRCPPSFEARFTGQFIRWPMGVTTRTKTSRHKQNLYGTNIDEVRASIQTIINSRGSLQGYHSLNNAKPQPR